MKVFKFGPLSFVLSLFPKVVCLFVCFFMALVRPSLPCIPVRLFSSFPPRDGKGLVICS